MRVSIHPSKQIYGQQPLTVLVVGASGDLARAKTYPALFQLFCAKNALSSSSNSSNRNLRIAGFARTPLSEQQFRDERIR